MINLAELVWERRRVSDGFSMPRDLERLCGCDSCERYLLAWSLCKIRIPV